jgi:biopolymer transport protein ExbD
MLLRLAERFRTDGLTFNMTPVIDIVFLLIVFFVVVFQFISTDDTKVQLPVGCGFAESIDENRSPPAIITAGKTDDGRVNFSVGTEKIQATDNYKLMQMMQKSLNQRLRNLPESQRVVVLRIDKNVSFEDAQYALAAAAECSANRLRLATLAEKNQDKD